MNQANPSQPLPNSPAPVPQGDTPLRPALFARFGDLSSLRYDYPLVLVQGQGSETVLRPLSRIIDDVLRICSAPGAADEALRQQVLALEGSIRSRIEQGATGKLSDLWRESVPGLLKSAGEKQFGPMDRNLDRAREDLDLDGLLIGCNGDTPHITLSHIWKAVHDERAKVFRKTVDGFILQIADILKADYNKSDDAHKADALRGSVGSTDSGIIDFHKLSAVLGREHPEGRLPKARLRRLEWVLSILGSQRFFGPGRSSGRGLLDQAPHSHIFQSCEVALEAFRERLPEVVLLVKALSTAELEVAHKYNAELHDPIISALDESDLTAEHLRLLPPALVLLRDGKSDNADTVRAFEALASGLPIKVLVQTDDILGETTPAPSQSSFGAASARLAAMAMGLNNVFSCQVSAAHIYRVGHEIVRGMQFDGPALFSIYSGATETAPGVAPYLMAAAATESRAFPTFVYDPSGGPDWSQRFSLNCNPSVTQDWPAHSFQYEEANGNKADATLPFTFADFAITDVRNQRYCHMAGKNAAPERLIPASERIAHPDGDSAEPEPFVFAIDPENRLSKVVIDTKIVEAAENCADAWGRLQELAGINNSHVVHELARARAAWQAEHREDAPSTLERLSAPTPPADSPVAEAQPQPAAPDPAPQADVSDAPWIETLRCTTCNECTQINGVTFAYNDDMQAYIADPDGGSFRQMVEAAESCQVSIIHPGKPRNPKEPDLAQLIERAAVFD
ncbi:MAG: hypothetical protein GXP05_10275 [Alphaproteobacteria bacterium]|nr:hypothetical protein [Alphaproteobacteria bacterium]